MLVEQQERKKNSDSSSSSIRDRHHGKINPITASEGFPDEAALFAHMNNKAEQ